MTTNSAAREPAATGADIDVGGLLRRARRHADLSQRDLADRAGVARSVVGRAESGSANIGIKTFNALISAAGCRLAVLERNANELLPMRDDAIRNNGGSRYPAHLDPRITSWLYRVGGGPRRSRPLPRLSLERRTARDARRASGLMPMDHPGADDLRRFHDQERADAALRHAKIPLPLPEPDCECGPECERECVPECPCQCEPAGVRRAG